MGQIPNLVKVLGIHEDSHLGTSEEGDILNLKTHGIQLKGKGPFIVVSSIGMYSVPCSFTGEKNKCLIGI